MAPLTIEQTLSHFRDVKAVIARDAERRSFMGVPVGDVQDRVFLFVEIDRVTALELERGEVDLQTVISQRGIGLMFEATNDADR